MSRFLKAAIPSAIAIGLFIGMTYLLRSNTEAIQGVLNEESSLLGMLLYVLIGIATVMIPFGSLVPFIPVAVLLWGWQMTALLTLLAWVIGSQIIFEAARYLGKPYVMRHLSKEKQQMAQKIVHGHGFIHAVMVRLFVHGDIVSYAFGIFTHMNRWTFLAVTAIGVLPGAISYAYVGSMPLTYQIAFVIFAFGAAGIYGLVQWKWPKLLRPLQKRIEG